MQSLPSNKLFSMGGDHVYTKSYYAKRNEIEKGNPVSSDGQGVGGHSWESKRDHIQFGLKNKYESNQAHGKVIQATIQRQQCPRPPEDGDSRRVEMKVYIDM